MEKDQRKTQEQELTKSAQKKAEVHSASAYKCSNCGTSYSKNDKFCLECGKGLKSTTCPYCGTFTKSDYEICPDCGKNLQAELCSFCGEAMDSDSCFCPECGNSRMGIVCKQCETLNFRNFCRKCNTPLNEQALQALTQAKADPKFKKALALAEELAELEEFLFSQPDEEGVPPEIPELSDENKQLINQYKDILLAFRGQENQEKLNTTPPKPEVQPEPKPQIKLSVNIASKEEAMAKYKEKLVEMQETLSSMIPDAGMTPQMQRDYYSARKVEIVTKTKKIVPLYWICKAYGCKHRQPNECAEPFKGGDWVYKEEEEITSTWINQ